MWGIFRRRDTAKPEESGAAAVSEHANVRENATEPILERPVPHDLEDGVPIGENPSDWLDQVRATRAKTTRDSEPDTSVFAPTPNLSDAATEVAPGSFAADTAADAPENSLSRDAVATPDSAPDDATTETDRLDTENREAAPEAAERGSASADSTGRATPLAHDGSAPDPAAENVPNTAEPNDPQAASYERWLTQLAQLGGPTPLRNYAQRRGTYIDLTTAHPSGIATLLARRPVMLSSLVREPIAFRAAMDAAGQVARRGTELESSRGLTTVHLAMGLAHWSGPNGARNAPVFLRSASLRRLGRDYEVRLRGKLHPNVTLLRALYDDGVTLRASDLMANAEDTGSLLPEAAFARLREVAGSLPGFVVESQAHLSTFADFADAMVADFAAVVSNITGNAPERDRAGHPIIDALAGKPGARERLDRRIHAETPINPDRRDPASDRLLLDADTEQEAVVDAVLGGSNLVVETLPGTGVTQTVVNVIGHLIDRDRRVLVITPRTASIREIRASLTHLGLGGLAVTPRTLRRDLMAGISRNERAERPKTAELDDALVRLRRVLADYRTALTADDDEFGVCPLDVLEELSRLELLDVPPSTTARLGHEQLVALRDPAQRAEAAAQMRELAELGEFRFSPEDSPWYDVVFESTEQVDEVYSTAVTLADGRMSTLLREAEALLAQTNLRAAETFTELGIYLRLLADIRETLDRFTPEIFDADLGELIEATGARREGSEMSVVRRRELRAYAREFVRPGVAVGELHESFKYVQRQRIMWHRYVRDAAQPSIPVGIDRVREQWREINELVQLVDARLATGTVGTLAEIPLIDIEAQLQRLAARSEVLENTVERLALNERLRAAGLGELLDDLTARHLEADEVAAELELAWWQSVLEQQLLHKKALLNANTRVLTRLEGDFRVVDEAHTESSAEQLAWQLAQAWKVALIDYADQAEALRELLRKPGVTSRQLVERADEISRPVSQVWLASPYDVPRIDPRVRFDTVLLLDAAAYSVAEALGGIRRANQVVAFGDPVTQYPAPFSVAVLPSWQHATETSTDAQLAELVADTAYAQLAQLLPTISLTRSYRAGGEDLTELVNARFYGGRLHSMPWAGTFLGHSSLTYSYVPDGVGLPDTRTGTVEATDAEVTRVVQLVLDHAIHRPSESLMVVSASATHAERVEQAVWSAVSARSDIAEFFTSPRGEPFLVATVEAAASQARDRVIFSLGYGVTPHGRVLSDFGMLGTPIGERALAVTMTRARRSLVIVSCVRPDQFEISRLTRGTVALAEILAELAERPQRPGGADPNDSDAPPMLVDLARRLAAFGMRVELDFRGEIPLAASYGNRAIVVDMDVAPGRDARLTTLRESLRLRPELLKRLGWYYLRVRAFELFANPEAVARRIAQALEVPIVEEGSAEPQELTMGKPQLPHAPEEAAGSFARDAVADVTAPFALGGEGRALQASSQVSQAAGGEHGEQ